MCMVVWVDICSLWLFFCCKVDVIKGVGGCEVKGFFFVVSILSVCFFSFLEMVSVLVFLSSCMFVLGCNCLVNGLKFLFVVSCLFCILVSWVGKVCFLVCVVSVWVVIIIFYYVVVMKCICLCLCLISIWVVIDCIWFVESLGVILCYSIGLIL